MLGDETVETFMNADNTQGGGEDVKEDKDNGSGVVTNDTSNGTSTIITMMKIETSTGTTVMTNDTSTGTTVVTNDTSNGTSTDTTVVTNDTPADTTVVTNDTSTGTTKMTNVTSAGTSVVTNDTSTGTTVVKNDTSNDTVTTNGTQSTDTNVDGAQTSVTAAVPLDLLSCRVCQSGWTSPRLLPCYHTVCSHCLNTHIAAQKSPQDNRQVFPCPLCSIPTRMPQPGQDNQLDHTDYASRFEPDAFVEKLANVLNAFRDADKSCDLCQRRNIKENAATDWCMECLDAMCQACLKVHLSGKTTRDHTVVSLEELRKLPLASVMRRGVQQTCREHMGETVRFYCLNCSLPVCVQCLTLRHRKCEQCVPLDDAMTSMGDAVADVIVRMRSVTSTGPEGGGGRSDVIFYQSGAQVLEESVREAEEKIRSLASDLRQAITEREEELLERLHSVASQLQEKVGDFRDQPGSREDDVKTLTSAHARLEALMKFGSDVEVLEMYQAVQRPLSRLEGTDSHEGGEDEVNLTVRFSPENLVQAFRRDFQSLGEVHVQDTSTDDGLASWGVAVTEKDEIIVVDCRNRRVQKFGCSGDLLDHIQVSNEPRDVTSCGRGQLLQQQKFRGGEAEEEVAVTLSGKQVYIITVTAKMALKRRFKTSKQYDSIAYSAAHYPSPGSTKTSVATAIFLVSCLEERCVDVISSDGDVIKTFGGSDVRTGTLMFTTPRYVAVTKEGHFAVSDSSQSCVVCFTQNGGAEFHYAPEGSHAIQTPQGVCGDRFGNLFLADYGNSRVHMVTPDGQFDRFVLGPDSGLRRPVAIAMTPKSSKLVLVQSDGVVKVFSYADTKVKMKVPCWCPRCSVSTDEGETLEEKQGEGHQAQGRFFGGRSRASSLASSGSGSRGSRSGSESFGPLSPNSPVFHTPHLNGRMKKF